jgi:hypothetical protein
MRREVLHLVAHQDQEFRHRADDGQPRIQSGGPVVLAPTTYLSMPGADC